MLALYRKYRPKIFEDLLGQEATVEILKNTAAEDKFAHAYLFYGPRGSGKTTAARLVAKTINCETRRDNKDFTKAGEPCNKCRVCKDIDEGRGIDVVEIDAASNRGIDEIRNLKEGIRLSPLAYRFKVFIIDEVHMLTRDAFNALLKTLEEPPAHAVFILATTELEKVPATIISRTQRFAFHRLPKQIIKGKLEAICKAEKIKADEQALELIAIAAEGSLRDAEALLDQLGSSGSEVTLLAVQKTLGRVGVKKLADFSELLITKDLSASLKFLVELEKDSQSFTQFTKDLIHFLRRVLSARVAAELLATFENDFTKEEIQKIKDLGVKADTNFLIALIKNLIKAYSEMRYSPFAMVPLEVAIIEILTK
ncbi:MAG: DNA polymerase III subunit gamma/tau [bacterium]|nr:DNA polymerase III subunit gamma/tau [bacterium]